MNMGFWCFCWVWYMGFDEINSIMLVLHVYTICSCIMLWFVLCCAYHVSDKMSFRCFCMYFWTPLSTKILGIIMFPCLETSNDYVFSHFAPCMFSCPICTLLHIMHTYIFWHVKCLMPWLYHALMFGIFTCQNFELLFKFQFLGFNS